MRHVYLFEKEKSLFMKRKEGMSTRSISHVVFDMIHDFQVLDYGLTQISFISRVSK